MLQFMLRMTFVGSQPDFLAILESFWLVDESISLSPNSRVAEDEVFFLGLHINWGSILRTHAGCCPVACTIRAASIKPRTIKNVRL